MYLLTYLFTYLLTTVSNFATGTISCSPVNECDFYNGECSQVCVDTDDSYYCDCHQGYKLAPNDYNCPGQSCQLPAEYGTVLAFC